MSAKINIVTKQYDKNRLADTIKIKTNCDVYNKNDDIYVVYKEEENGNVVTTRIKISDEQVSIKKFGSTNSTMTFKNDTKDEVKYRTSQGLFIIEINTNSLKIDKKIDKCIKLDIDYNIKIMDLFEGRNKISISVEMK